MFFVTRDKINAAVCCAITPAQRSTLDFAGLESHFQPHHRERRKKRRTTKYLLL
jgi:hypothetical protein